MPSPNRSTLLRLQNELRELKNSNVGTGFVIFPPNDMLNWKVAIFGSPDTVYQGGYFVANLSFPINYPHAPPALKFINPPFHPNVYQDGNVCISILHSTNNNEMSGEADSERWNITQSVRTVLLSVISMLSEPNLSSPANIPAAQLYREWKGNQSALYAEQIKTQVEASKAIASEDGIIVPLTQELYVTYGEKAEEKSIETDIEDETQDDYDE